MATNLAKSKLLKDRMLNSTIPQKLKVLKTALIRRDVASDIDVCKCSINLNIQTVFCQEPNSPATTNLQRSKRLQGEELGGPQLKVESETVQESPEQHHLTGSQPEDGDAIGAQRRRKLLPHILVFPAQMIVHIPAGKDAALEPLDSSGLEKLSGKLTCTATH